MVCVCVAVVAQSVCNVGGKLWVVAQSVCNVLGML